LTCDLLPGFWAVFFTPSSSLCSCWVHKCKAWCHLPADKNASGAVASGKRECVKHTCAVTDVFLWQTKQVQQKTQAYPAQSSKVWQTTAAFGLWPHRIHHMICTCMYILSSVMMQIVTAELRCASSTSDSSSITKQLALACRRKTAQCTLA